jgi:hypothetical protein
MIRSLTVALLVAGAATVLPAGTAEAKAKPCQAKGSRTLVSTSKVRVYEVGDIDLTVYGCLRSTGKRKVVADYTSCGCSVGDEPTPRIWVNSEALAVNRYGCPPPGLEGDCGGTVASFDLRKRSKRYGEDVPKGFVAQLALKANGSFAYIAADTVRKADSAGIGQLDPGPMIESGSLARAGSIVYWTKAGQAFSARLQ